MKALSVAIAFATLAGCGSNDDSATLNLALTDAPIADVAEVNIHINSIQLKKNSDTFTFEINQSINLLDLQGSASTNLLKDEVLPAGQYQYIRLDLDADANNIVFIDDSTENFTIPSEATSGLKLNSPFELSANGNANFTLDFDVAKSLSESNQGYKMRPTIRIVDNSEIGHISGEVAADLLVGCESNLSAYAFTGSDTAFAEITSTTGPVTSATVKFEEQVYSYELGYLEAGDYTVHLVCGIDDALVDDGLTSLQSNNTTVEAKTTTDLGFEVPQV